MKLNRQLLLMFCGTILVLVPTYLMRFKESVYAWFFNYFSTYPGDLWNFFANYLGRGAHYPPEYPVGLRFFYEVMNFENYASYTSYFAVNAIILTLFACAITYLLYKIIHNSAPNDNRLKNIWMFWILAPSLMFYGFINYDLPVIFIIVLAVFLFMKEKYYGAIVCLAIGMVLKVFPMFLLPVFILKSPRNIRWFLLVIFGGIVSLLNLPYMISDFNTWIFPYIWQISSNITTGPQQGTYWWILYPILGKFTGWFSLILLSSLYVFTYRKLKNAPFVNICLAIIFIFLLTDRIYSPQYSMYMLPFLALVTYQVNKKYFYLAEIPNFFIVFLCFFLKENPLYLQILVFIRYYALIRLYWINLHICHQEKYP